MDDSRLRTAARCVIDRRDFLKGTIALGAAGALSPMSSTALNAEIAARKAAEAAEAAARIAADDALSARIAALESPVIPPSVPPAPPPPSTLPSTIPASIDATGKTDVSAALAAYLNGVPAGSVVAFPPSGVYAIASALKLQNRQNIEFAGQGATIKAIGSGYNENYSIFYFQSFGGTNQGNKLHGFNLVGNSPTPGKFIAGQEGQHGILADGGGSLEIYGCTCTAMYGDFLEVNSGSTGVYAHDNHVVDTGRNGLSVIWGNGVRFVDNALDVMGYMPFDVEPNTASEPCFGIDVEGGTVGSWTNAFFAVDGSSTGAAIHDITVKGVVCKAGLLTVINPSGKARESNIAIVGNAGLATTGPVVTAKAIDGLTVTGNTPAKSGAFLAATGCTSVVSQ